MSEEYEHRRERLLDVRRRARALSRDATAPAATLALAGLVARLAEELEAAHEELRRCKRRRYATHAGPG